jgi:DNA-binding NarL/FixJ family response regulator
LPTTNPEHPVSAIEPAHAKQPRLSRRGCLLWLKLPAQGLTDEAAAARLGVSHRTARRMMAELMERLGARSRFEAGLRAAQRGWLWRCGRSSLCGRSWLCV